MTDGVVKKDQPLAPQRVELKPEKQRIIKLDLKYELSGAQRYMFFNRFSLEQIGPHKLIHFGLVSETGTTVDSASCLIDSYHWEQNKSRLSDYLGKLESIEPQESTKWTPPQIGGHVGAVTVVNMCRVSNLAEISLLGYVVQTAITDALSSATRQADILAVLRCDVSLQKLLLVKLLTE